MKKINKEKQQKFVEGAKKILIENGCTLLDKKYEGQNHLEYRYEGKNPITFTLWPVGHHETCFSVYGRYKNPMYPVTNLSGKYNFHLDNNMEMVKILDVFAVHTKMAINYSNQ